MKQHITLQHDEVSGDTFRTSWYLLNVAYFFIQRQKFGTPGETPQNKLMHIHRHHHCHQHHPTLYIRIIKKNSCYKSTLFESQSLVCIRVKKRGLSLVYTRVKKKTGLKSGLHKCQKGRHWPG